jgi:hypothetical protein
MIGPLIDTSLGVTPKREYLLRTDAGTEFLGHWNFDSYLATADIWPTEDVGDEFRTEVVSHIPVHACRERAERFAVFSEWSRVDCHARRPRSAGSDSLSIAGSDGNTAGIFADRQHCEIARARDSADSKVCRA